MGKADAGSRRAQFRKAAASMSLSFKHVRGFHVIEDVKEYYDWKKELGVGTFGTVHEAIAKKIGGKCAVKVIHKSKVAEDKVWEELLK